MLLRQLAYRNGRKNKMTQSEDALNNKIGKINIAIKNISLEIGNISLNDALKNITKELSGIFTSYLTTCWVSENENLKLLAQFGLSEAGIKKFESTLPTGKKILSALEKKQVTIDNVSDLESPVIKKFLTEEGIFAIVEIPFFKRDVPYGILEIYATNKEDWEIDKWLFFSASNLITLFTTIFDAKLSTDEEIKKLKLSEQKTISELTEKLALYEKETADLKRFQEVTIGRESVMIELKGRIRQLEKQLKEYVK